LVGYRKVYSVRCEADVVMTSVTSASGRTIRDLSDKSKRDGTGRCVDRLMDDTAG
jgi:hypothetical protein